jgi:hypothetical protein
MREARYRLHMTVRGDVVVRDIVLNSEKPIIDILNWVEDEYEFKATLKKVYLLRDDGVEEQVYQR